MYKIKVWWIIIGVLFLTAFWLWQANYERNTLKMYPNIENESRAEYLYIPPKQTIHLTIEKYYQSLPQTVSKSIFDIKQAKQIVLNTLIEKENFSAKAYPDGCLKQSKITHYCVEVRYSIGYGTLANSKYEVISKTTARKRKLAHLENEVYKYIPKEVNNIGDFVALSDIGYNAGHQAIKSVYHNHHLDIKKYQEWVLTQGKYNPGLEQRRKDVLIYSLANQ